MCDSRENIKQIRDFDSLFEVIEYFDTEQKCQEHLAMMRWDGCPTCPYCESDRIGELQGKTKRFKCYGCRSQFGVKVGTIFHDSKISLRKWFFAIFLFSAHKKGVSSHQLSRDLKVTQKSAWFMLHRIRFVYQTDAPCFEMPCEMDETYVGGKESNKHQNKKTKNTQGRSTKTKTPVVAVLERGGRIFAKPTTDASGQTLGGIAKETIKEGTKVYTDEWTGYNVLDKDYDREFVRHSIGEYVRFDVHTNGVENFWSHLKRGILGIYHHTAAKHLGAYVDEFAFRFNERKISDGTRFDLTLKNVEKRLTYKELIGKGKTASGVKA